MLAKENPLKKTSVLATGRSALELETSPSAPEAATLRSYLPVNYERVHMQGTLVPAITRSAPQKKGNSKKKRHWTFGPGS
jgi:hypothetical protein